MDHNRPGNASAVVARLLSCVPKSLFAVVLVIFAGCGVGQSQFPTVPQAKSSTVAQVEPRESVRKSTSEGPREKATKVDTPETDSQQSPSISPRRGGSNSPTSNVKNPNTRPQPPPGQSKTATGTRIPKVMLRNQAGKLIYTGPIDLQPTLDRIKNGERNRHRNDGAVFQNREGKLPRKQAGYYHEYVVPTPGESGPGPQRLIQGATDEIYYTADHYKSFQRVKP